MWKNKIIVVLLLASSLYATDVSDFLNLKKCDQIIDKQIYKVCYSYKYKGALGGWTVLYGDKVNAVNIKKRPRFYENKSIPRKYRSRYKDYTGTGRIWNRGHFIIADADADYSQKSLNLVYDMSNIQSQNASLNQKLYLKAERYGRGLATKLGYIHSVSVADYRNAHKTIKNRVVIPTGFYRIYYNDDVGFKKCFYFPNDRYTDYSKEKLRDYVVSCE